MNYRLLLRIGRKKTNFYGPIFLLPVEDKIGFKTQKLVQNRQNDDFSSPGADPIQMPPLATSDQGLH